MDTPQNGGPAFPGYEIRIPAGREPYEMPVPGMTLRDYFAAAALTGLLATSGPDGRPGAPNYSTCVEHAYAAANAMLDERKRPDRRGI